MGAIAASPRPCPTYRGGRPRILLSQYHAITSEYTTILSAIINKHFYYQYIFFSGFSWACSVSFGGFSTYGKIYGNRLKQCNTGNRSEKDGQKFPPNLQIGTVVTFHHWIVREQFSAFRCFRDLVISTAQSLSER